MKLIHISDLHLGKRFKERSLIEDQKHVLDQIIRITEEEKATGVMIAGDIYDKPVPPGEAVLLFDEFLVRLREVCDHIFIISGNHDSAERLSFGNRIMEKGGVHLSPCFDGRMKKVTLRADGEQAEKVAEGAPAGDRTEEEPVNIWMLPFVKPVHVREYFEDLERDDYTGAIKWVIENSSVDFAEKNILMGHQYVTGSERSESEEVPVGGLDGVSAEAFEGFDYVALGHLHKAQPAGGENIRYCGSPLRYSFSEEKDSKQLLVVEIKNDGVEIESRELLPLRDVKTIKGTFDQLMTEAHKMEEGQRKAYIRAELTDKEYIPDAIQRLRSAYPNILEVRYEDVERGGSLFAGRDEVEEKTPFEYLEDFFRAMRGREMTGEQKAIARQAIQKIWEDEE